MRTIRIESVIMIAIALIVIAIVLPLGLANIGSAGWYVANSSANASLGEARYLKDVIDPAVITLLTILLPILVVIGIIMYFIPRSKS